MINNFEITGPNSTRPDAARIIFCDGTDDRLFQAETDLELSHWRPNRTPAEFRAGTSTEICFQYLDNPQANSWTVAVNNHVDVDGILSVYALLHSRHALTHRQTIIEAAEMGDFWGWGETPSQRLFQGITHLFQSGFEGKAAFETAFRAIPSLIDGTHPNISEIDHTLIPLQHGVNLVETGQIHRSLIGNRLAHYVVPLHVASVDDEEESYVPDFNEAISEKTVLWPHVRARWDAQRACLVSVERTTGWFHDLWFPGYLWADTAGLWQVPDFKFFNGMRSYELTNPKLIAVFEDLQRQETATGHWGLGGTPLPFGTELQSRFPLVGRFLSAEGQFAISQLQPDQVVKAFKDVLN